MLGRLKIEWVTICGVLRTVLSRVRVFKMNILQKWGHNVREPVLFFTFSPNIQHGNTIL